MAEANEGKQGSKIGPAAARAGAYAARNAVVKKVANNHVARILIVKATATFLAILLLMMPILFLFALPMMMFEALMTFIDKLNDVFSTAGYEMSAGVNFMTALKNATKGIIDATLGQALDWLGNAWASFKSWLFGDSSRKEAEGYSDIDEEHMGDEATELRITQEEAAQKETLSESLEMTQEAYEKRTTDLKDSIMDPGSGLAGYISNTAWGLFVSSGFDGHAWSSAHTDERHPYENREAAVNETLVDYYQYEGATVSVNAGKLGQMDAARIMSIYTVAKGTSLQNMNLSDYQKWLGYNPGYVGAWWPWNVDDCTVPIDVGLGNNNPRVERYIGFCLPQYLQDQVDYEMDTFGGTLCGAYGPQSCAAIDMVIVVDAPPASEMVPTVNDEIVTETRYYKVVVMPDGSTPPPVIMETSGKSNASGPVLTPLTVHVDINDGGGGSSYPPSTLTPPPTAEPQPVEMIVAEEFTYVIHHVSYFYSVSIRPRDPLEVLDILGFKGTENALDVNSGVGFALGGNGAVGDSGDVTNNGAGHTPGSGIAPEFDPEDTMPTPTPLPGEVVQEIPTPSPGADVQPSATPLPDSEVMIPPTPVPAASTAPS